MNRDFYLLGWSYGSGGVREWRWRCIGALDEAVAGDVADARRYERGRGMEMLLCVFYSKEKQN